MDIILKYFSDFTDQQLKQLRALDHLYKEWNSKINVISRKDIAGLHEKHILHSLSIAAIFDFNPGTEIVDIGTGGGFPGIPLAIFFPEVKFHLVDSIAKKLKVVEAIAASIGLMNVTIQHIRAEEIKNRKFDFVVSRAVAPLKDVWKWSKSLLKKSRESGVGSQESGVGSQQSAVRSRESENKTSTNELRTSLTTHDSRLPTHDSPPTPDSRLPTRPRLTTPEPGLICLKGGDLSIEIQESKTQPRIISIDEIFKEESFKKKYILYIPR